MNQKLEKILSNLAVIAFTLGLVLLVIQFAFWLDYVGLYFTAFGVIIAILGYAWKIIER